MRGIAAFSLTTSDVRGIISCAMRLDCIARSLKSVYRLVSHKDGRVPERLIGTGCKPVGFAYHGSNPCAPTTFCLCSSGVEHFLGKEEAIGSNPITGSIYFTLIRV